MPRNASGTYTLPSGNPVEAGTLIEASWANTTLEDVGNELTNSLSRTGEGGMLAPFRLADGTLGAPGIAWLNEPSTGFYRYGTGEMWGVVQGTAVLQYTANGVLVPTGRTFTAQGNVTVGGTLGVTGAITASGGLNGGSVSGTTGTFSSTLSVTGATTLASDLTLSGTAKRIYGDFSSNSPISNRLIVQTSTANSNTLWTIMPNGTSTTSRFIALNNSDPTNSNAIQLSALSTDVRVQSLANGSASAVPLYLQMGGTTVAAVSTGNNFLVGTTTDDGVNKLQVTGGVALNSGTANGVLYLNGSKVATSGSALTFDGSKLLVSSSGEQLKLLSSGDFTTTGTGYIRFYDSGGAKGYLGFAGTASQMDLQSGPGMNMNINATGGTFTFAVSNNEQMRLTSTGLGIGTNSPAAKLDVKGIIRVNEDGIGTKILTIRSDYAGVDPAINVTTNNSLLLMTNNTIQATLSATGNLGIGTSSPITTLDVYSVSGSYRDAIILSNSAITGANQGIAWGSSSNISARIKGIDDSSYGTNILFETRTGGPSTTTTERARITSGGSFLIGATAAVASEKLYVTGSVANYVTRFYNSNASPNGTLISYTGAAPNGTGNSFLRCDDTGALRAEIRSNGGLANFQANDVNLSDRREKTNFAPAKSYLDAICAIPVQTFNYIDQSENDPGLTLGVVAQDVQAVAPELVSESNWGTEDEPKMRLSIYQTDLQYALMKCIQELKAEVDSLKAQLEQA
jgi:hypothetical protein